MPRRKNFDNGGTDVDKTPKKIVKDPNNVFNKLLYSSFLFYIFIAIVLVIVIWWMNFMLENSKS